MSDTKSVMLSDAASGKSVELPLVPGTIGPSCIDITKLQPEPFEALITSMLGSAYTNILAFSLVIFALAVKPHGLLGKAGVKKV